MRSTPKTWTLMSLCACLNLGCADDFASEGSTSQGAETGAAEEGGDADPDAGLVPGPHGPGCAGEWEGWWSEAQSTIGGAATIQAGSESASQRGRWYASGALDALPSSASASTGATENFRATLISEAAVLSTGRNQAVSWCLGGILPNPQGPGGLIDEELDASNLERYLLFRKELERAIRAWERHSRMNFVHLVPLDDRRKPSGGMCDTSLEHVWFRAQTHGCTIKYQGLTNANGANEFDPDAGSPENPGGYHRVLCIAWQLLEAAKTRIPYYAGHESGHIVGLDHEHVRWDQGEKPNASCVDNDPFEPVPAERILTAPDPWSVRATTSAWAPSTRRASAHTT